jgi:hypothetical protein
MAKTRARFSSAFGDPAQECFRSDDAEGRCGDRRIIDQQYALARKLLEENRDKVEAMTQALLEWETIDADQIDDIMAGKPPRPPKPSQSTVRPSAPSDTPGANQQRLRLHKINYFNLAGSFLPAFFV